MTTATLAAPFLTGKEAGRRFPQLAETTAYLDSLRGRADLRILERLLLNLAITRADIEEYCVFGQRGYRRNTIARSDHYELLALCWRTGHCTPIHDHRGVSCAFKVIHGVGTEIRFKLTASGMVCPVATIQMPPGYVCSADDDDIHQVANMQAPGQDLITLHIYSPPISHMNTFRFSQPLEMLGVYGADDELVSI
jgi:cysteine dioxygenase